ncbi:MAG: glycosyltransferase family 39 protein [Armatimonas sp.]
MEKDDFPASRWLVPLGLLIGAALLLLFPLAKPIWTDEGISIGWGRTPLSLILSGRFGSPDALPLHPLYLALVGRPLGDTLAIHRLISALPAAVGLWYIYLIGRRISERVGVLTLWLAALSPGLILFDRMSRYHGLTALLGVMSCYYFLRLLSEEDRKLPIKYGIVTALLLLSYVLSVFVVAAQFVFLVLYWKRTPRPIAIFIAMAVATLVFAGYFIPNMLRANRDLVGVNVKDPSMGQGINGFLRRFFLPVYVFCVGETLSPWKVWFSLTGCGIALSTFVMGIWSLRKRPELLMPLACFAVVLLSALATSSKLGSSQTVGSMAKRVSFVLPMFYLAVATGMFSIRQTTVRNALAAVLLIISSISTFNYFAGKEFLNPNYTVNWNEAITVIKEKQLDDNTIIFSSAESSLMYYMDENGVANRLIGKVRGVDELKDALASKKYKHLWLVGRDRGDRIAVADFEAVRKLVLDSGAHQVYAGGVYPRTDDEKKWLGKALKRDVWPYYVVLELYELP